MLVAVGVAAVGRGDAKTPASSEEEGGSGGDNKA
jgi:hypothetical protein